MREQGSNNVIVTSAHRDILRQSSQDTISKSATIQRPETSIIIFSEHCLIMLKTSHTQEPWLQAYEYCAHFIVSMYLNPAHCD